MRGNSTATTIEVGLGVGFVAERLAYGQILVCNLVFSLKSSTFRSLKRLRVLLQSALALETVLPSGVNPPLPSEK